MDRPDGRPDTDLQSVSVQWIHQSIHLYFCVDPAATRNEPDQQFVRRIFYRNGDGSVHLRSGITHRQLRISDVYASFHPEIIHLEGTG